jgi:hypothetical protein
MSRLLNSEALAGSIPSPELRAWLDNIDDDSWLTRREASIALKELEGLDVSPATLASLATRGGGPRYRVFMNVAKSQWRDLRQWAQSRVVYRGGETIAA